MKLSKDFSSPEFATSTKVFRNLEKHKKTVGVNKKCSLSSDKILVIDLLAMAAPRSIKFNQNILVGIVDDLLKVFADNDLDGFRAGKKMSTLVKLHQEPKYAVTEHTCPQELLPISYRVPAFLQHSH